MHTQQAILKNRFSTFIIAESPNRT